VTAEAMLNIVLNIFLNPPFNKKRKRDIGMGTGGKKYYCTATPYSQGEDWISTYSYNIGVTPEGVQQRIAYVACDYVK
jgi:hypothetical protein